MAFGLRGRRALNRVPCSRDDSALNVPECAFAIVLAIVFLDIGMPDMNGYEVARQMRQRPELKSVVVAALTGWGQAADRQRSKDADIDHHLVKPIDSQAPETVLGTLTAAPLLKHLSQTERSIRARTSSSIGFVKW